LFLFETVIYIEDKWLLIDIGQKAIHAEGYIDTADIFADVVIKLSLTP